MLIHSSRVCDPWRGGHALACESAYRDARFCEHPMESYALRSSPGTRVARSWWSSEAKSHNQSPQITLPSLMLLPQAPQATHSWAFWCSTNYDALPYFTMLLKRKFWSCENLTFCKKYGIIYIENERRREEEKSRLPPMPKIFSKKFFDRFLFVRCASLMGVCPPPRVTCWYGTCVVVPVSIHYSSLWQGNLPRWAYDGTSTRYSLG